MKKYSMLTYKFHVILHSNLFCTAFDVNTVLWFNIGRTMDWQLIKEIQEIHIIIKISILDNIKGFKHKM